MGCLDLPGVASRIYPELSGPRLEEKLACTVLSLGLLIFAVHAVEGVVKEVVEHAKEAGEKGTAEVGAGGGGKERS